MRKWLLSGLLVGSALACWPSAALAAPANDAFSAAAPLTVGADVSSSNVDATVEAGEPDPTGFAASESCPNIAAGPSCGTSVWYTFQAPSTGQYTISTCDGGTDVYSIVGVYTGTTIGTAVQVAASGQSQQCNSVSDLGGTQVTFGATMGTVYHVDVAGHGGRQGSFYLRAYSGAAKSPPSPDTAVVRRSSIAAELNARFSSAVMSGPRRTGSFALVSDVAGAGFECSLDGAPFASCDTTASYDALAPGSSHVFQARAVAGGATDSTPLVERFTIDTAPPDTVLLSGPTGPIASKSAEWTYGNSERYDRDLFACGLDSIPIFACFNGQKYDELCAGSHNFHVAALDYAANADPTPANASFQVTTGTACAAPTVSPSSSVVPTSTGALLHVPYDDKGAGGVLRLEYGPTTSYGMVGEDTSILPGPASETKRSIMFLPPGTTSHYRVTIATPFGSASTGDQTVTTKAAEGALPTVVNGTPRVTGEHAASIPATIDPGSLGAAVALYVEPSAPVTGNSPRLEVLGALSPSGPQPVTAGAVDLEPATTYHYRFSADQQSGGGEVLGPEGAFTTPPYPKAHFKLTRRLIKVSRLTRRSKTLTIRLHGLPSGTGVNAQLKAGRKRLRKDGSVKTDGKLKLKVRLVRKFRRALLREGKLKLLVTARPPGDTASSVSITVKLHKSHKPHKHH